MHVSAVILQNGANEPFVGLGRFVRTQRIFAYGKSKSGFPETTFSLAEQRAMAEGFSGNAPLQAIATANAKNSPQHEKNSNQRDSVLTTLIARFMTAIASGSGMVRIPVNGICKAMIGGNSKLKDRLTTGAGMANTQLTERFVGLKTAVCLLFPIQHRISQ